MSLSEARQAQKSGHGDSPMHEVVVSVVAIAVRMEMATSMMIFHIFAFMAHYALVRDYG